MSTAKVVKSDNAVYDIFKALHVIEHDKDVDEIFRSDKIKLTYPMLRTMAKSKTLDEATADRVKEIFDRIIVKNQKLFKRYKSIIDDVSAEPKLPKWYGKNRVLNDIKLNNETSELDMAMLSLNKLKNIYSRLNARTIKDKHNETKILTKTDYREIIAVVRMVENKMDKILNKK